MQQIFERFTGDEKGNAFIDWTVLGAGLFLMALSLLLVVASDKDQVTADGKDAIQLQQGHLPG